MTRPAFVAKPLLPAIAVLVTACAGTPSGSPEVDGRTATESAAPAAVEGSCTPVSQLGNKVAPPEIYDHMVECARLSKYREGAFLFALAGTYSYYDALRVADAGKHAAHTALIRQSMAKLKSAKKNELKDEIRKSLSNQDKLTEVCKEVKDVGPPNYQPRYMAGNGSVKSIDVANGWKTALTNFLHCPG
jgi:hypothetical protein